MDHTVARIAHNLVARVTGPMKFRLLLQPAMATFFAVRDGLADARASKPPYFWGLFTGQGERGTMLRMAGSPLERCLSWRPCST